MPKERESGYHDEIPTTTMVAEQESDLNPDERDRWKQSMLCLREADQRLEELHDMLKSENPFSKMFRDVQERYRLEIIGLSGTERDGEALYQNIKEKIRMLDQGQWFQYANRRVPSSLTSYGFLTAIAAIELSSGSLSNSMRASALVNTFFRHRPEQQELWEPLAVKLDQIDRAIRQMFIHLGITPHTLEEIHFGENWYPKDGTGEYISVDSSVPYIERQPEVNKWLLAPEREGKIFVIDVYENSWGGKIILGPEKDTYLKTCIKYGRATNPIADAKVIR